LWLRREGRKRTGLGKAGREKEKEGREVGEREMRKGKLAP